MKVELGTPKTRPDIIEVMVSRLSFQYTIDPNDPDNILTNIAVQVSDVYETPGGGKAIDLSGSQTLHLAGAAAASFMSTFESDLNQAVQDLLIAEGIIEAGDIVG